MPPGGRLGHGGRVPPGEDADPPALLDDVDPLGRGALVVVAEGAERPGEGGVGGDVHERRAVGEAAEAGQFEERRAGEGGFPAEDAVELDGVADRLVDLEGQLARLEDEVGGGLGALRGGEEGDGLAGHPLGVAGQVEAADDLVAAGLELAEGLGVRPALGLRLAHGGGVHAAAALDEVLADAVPLAGDEPLLGCPRR